MDIATMDNGLIAIFTSIDKYINNPQRARVHPQWIMRM